VYPFGAGGQLKMIYDRRQRPQALYMAERVFMVFNGGAPPDATERASTYPFAISFDPKARTFSSPIKLGKKASKDQHYCPIIWADNDGFVHVLFGCHKTPGVHLVSRKRASIGGSDRDWSVAPEVRHSLSYPTVYHISGNRQVIYFRTGEHRSSWSYLVSDDEGRSWKGPERDVVDLNLGGDSPVATREPMANELSSYQTCLPSRDGKFLHVAFCYYDDNKRKDPEKFWNPRYGTKRDLGLKFNLYYVRIDLRTHEVTNFAGKAVKTPIGFDSANADCMIWDTEWRGAGIPPDIMIDENGNPAFLHVLSEDTPDSLNYYYVRFVGRRWVQTVIAPANDEWNSCHLRRDASGALHAHLIVGDRRHLGEEVGKMDSRGGGHIEEWVSTDKGNTWKRARDLTPRGPEYAGWKFNNIQPIRDPQGNVQEGMYLFYGWKDAKLCRGTAFLIVD
jgi:hypothetical protein